MMNVEKEYEEICILETAILEAPGWLLIKHTENNTENGIDETNIYYNSSIPKSVKIIKNNNTKYATIQDVPVKDLSSNKNKIM